MLGGFLSHRGFDQVHVSKLVSETANFGELASLAVSYRSARFSTCSRAFAGLWTRWLGVRGPKSAPIAGEHELFGFLTTKATSSSPIHPKAMPVILTTPEEFDFWLEADMLDALALQRPLADDALRIVAHFSGDVVPRECRRRGG
jgi:putative SOS response-associated peptidase YedK